MCDSMVDVQSPTAEIRRGKKKIEETTGKNIMSASATQCGHKKLVSAHHCLTTSANDSDEMNE